MPPVKAQRGSRSAPASKDAGGPPRVILLVNLVGRQFGGQEMHVLALCKALRTRGRQSMLLVFSGSTLHQLAEAAGVQCHAIPLLDVPGFYRCLRLALPSIMRRICTRHGVELIHCNNRFEVGSAVRAGRASGAKVLLNYHVTAPFDVEILRGLDAFIAPSPEIAQAVVVANRSASLGLRRIAALPPVLDAGKFLQYESSVGSREWFVDTFGIDIDRFPTIVAIGNMGPDLETKNYPLLFQALAKVIREQNTPLHAFLVGDGPARAHLESLTRTLGVEANVHFLGFTTSHTPGVLHHCDVFVLASSRESFGIVVVEAALMRKPAIGARDTGAERIIVHGETGLLFRNGNADDLAAAIHTLITRPRLARRYGARAYDHVTHHFDASRVAERYEALYASLVRA
jgi:glycosyltransferase involved in cell wall biosynthesis